MNQWKLLAAFVITATMLSIPWGEKGHIQAAEPPPAGGKGQMPVHIYGVVQDENGKPVPRARIWLRTGWLTQFHYRAIDSDEHGQFNIDVLEPIGPSMLFALANGYSFGGRTLHLQEGQPAQRVVLRLMPPEELRLSIQDEAGKPIQGAQLDYLAWKTSNTDLSLWPLDILTVVGIDKPVSDKDGVITLKGIPKGAKIDVRIKHPEFAQQKTDGIKAAKEPISVKLIRGKPVTFIAMNGSTRKPVPGALIEIWAKDLGAVFETADREGRATFRLAEAWNVDVSVRHAQLMLPQRMGIPRWGAVSGGTLEIELYPKVKVTGRCVEEKTEKPVAGIELGLVSRDSNVICSFGHSDADGHYEIEGPEGPVSVQAISGADRREKRKVEVDTTKTTQMPDLKLKLLPLVRGKVIGPDGKPVAGAFVMNTPFPRTTSFLTDKDGRFEFRMEEDDNGVAIAAFHPTEHLAASENIMLDDLKAGKEAQIHLQPESEIRGIVVDSDRKPCAGVTVWLAQKTDQGNGFSMGLRESTSTDAKGAYRFPGLARGAKQYVVCLGERPSVGAGANWITPTEKAIVLKPLTATAQDLKAKRHVLPEPAITDFRCRQWLNFPPPNIDSLRGKVMLLAFGATWSKPWAEQLAEMQMAHKLYADKGLVVIGIQHHGERNEDVAAFITKAGLTFPVGIDNTDSETFDRYQVNYYPLYVLIGRDGKRMDDQWQNGNFLAAIRKAVLYDEESGR